MTQVLWILGGIVLAVFGVPVLTLLVVMMARFGWLRANDKYRQLKEKKNGDATST